MKPYPQYKDSGVEWIGKVPEHWETVRLDHLVLVKARLGWKGLKASEYTQQGYGFLATPNIKYTEIDYENINYISEERYLESPEIMLQSNDVLLAKDGSTLGTVNIVSKLPFPCTVNSSIAVLRVKHEKLISFFLRYFLSSEIMRQIINMIKGGMGVPHLFQSDINNFKLLLPTIKEQTTISAFLDRKTAEIDSIIAKKERLIELYEEEKAAVINHAVTKGLDPAAKMKDSGIEWLGEIPEHWEVKKLKHLVCKIGSGVTPKGGASVYQQSGIPLLRSQNIHFDGLRLDDVAYISDEIHNDMSGSKVLSGDVLLNITGASIGRCYFVDDKLGEANVNQHVCIIRPSKGFITKFIYFLLCSNIGQIQIDLEQTGGGREGLNFEALGSFVIPAVNEEEQLAIVQHIRNKCSRIDAIISKFKRQVELLKEYRTALISEAVTGKIDVRENMHN